VWFVPVFLCVLAGACRRRTEDWLLDLRSTDPWRRRMASLALARVEEAELETAFRALTIRLLDMDPEVKAAIHDSLRVLAQRRPELPAQALEVLPVERLRFRSTMAELLLELEREGQASATAALTRFLEEELASGVSPRVEAAADLRRRRAPDDGASSLP
jgi:hypothetical protein